MDRNPPFSQAETRQKRIPEPPTRRWLVESACVALDGVEEYDIWQGEASGLLVLHGLAMYARIGVGPGHAAPTGTPRRAR